MAQPDEVQANRRILLGSSVAGLSLWILGLTALTWLYFVAPQQAIASAVAVATFYYAGQFGAIPLGLALGGHPLLIGIFVWAADAAGLLVFFPLTQLGIDRLASRPGRIAAWIRRLQQRAQRHQKWVERYGAYALFAFTSLPFLFNSPILGATMGRLGGLRPRTTLLALLSAITLMSGVWTLLFYLGIEQARALDERLPWLIGLGSVTVTILLAASVALARRLRTSPQPIATDDNA